MTTYSLNDREQQVTKAALKFFLDYKTGIQIDFINAKKWNEFDLLDTNHTRAHCITALKKFGVDFAKLQK